MPQETVKSKLTPLECMLLLHLEKVEVIYAANMPAIARKFGVSIEIVEQSLNQLVDYKIIQRFHRSQRKEKRS